MALKYLQEVGGSISARQLSERIAELETGESPPPRNARQSAYVSLHQTHLPKLDDLGIVEYDRTAKKIRLNDRAKEVSIYLEAVPRYGLAWSEFYAGLSVLGLLLVIAAMIGVPALSAVPPHGWALAALLAIGLAAGYQTIEQRSSLFHRLRE
ncbi:MAG: hypothetical protein ABEH65_10600 [Halobacteriales archaeon]